MPMHWPEQEGFVIHHVCTSLQTRAAAAQVPRRGKRHATSDGNRGVLQMDHGSLSGRAATEGKHLMEHDLARDDDGVEVSARSPRTGFRAGSKRGRQNIRSCVRQPPRRFRPACRWRRLDVGRTKSSSREKPLTPRHIPLC